MRIQTFSAVNRRRFAVVPIVALVLLGSPEFAFTQEPFRRGDANVDGIVDLADGVRILSALFLGMGDVPCRDALDADDSGHLDLSDAIFLLRHLFASGPELPAPGITQCGRDTASGDGLDCVEYRPSDAAFACPELPAADSLLPMPIIGSSISARTIMTGDFNGDGRIDVVRNDPSLRFAVYLGEGRGVFSEPRIVMNRGQLFVADLDGDDRSELVSVSEEIEGESQNGFRIFFNDGRDPESGGFRPGDFHPLDVDDVGRLKTGIAADINDDGHLDLVFASKVGRLEGVVVVNGDGAGGFGPALVFKTTKERAIAPEIGSDRLVAADFNGDERTDISFVVDRAVLLFFNDGAGSMYLVEIPTGSFLASVAEDIDGDGVLDIVLLSEEGSVGALVGGRDEEFEFMGLYQEATFADNFDQLFAVDMDGDGQKELVTLGDDGVILSRIGPREFFPVRRSPVTGSGTVVDIDGDGHMDLVGNAGGGFSIDFGPVADPAWSYQRFDAFKPRSYARQLEAVDLDGDGLDDLVLMTNLSVRTFFSLGDGNLSSSQDLAVDDHPKKFVVADVDQDSSPDLVVVGETGITTLFNSGDGTIAAGSTLALVSDRQPEPGLAVAGDVDSDTFTDIVVASAKQVWILFGAGDGTLTVQALSLPISTNAHIGGVVVSDLDGQGQDELLILASGHLHIFRSDGPGDFPRLTFVRVERITQFFGGVDLNNDEMIDIAYGRDGSLITLLGERDFNYSRITTGSPVKKSLVDTKFLDVDADGALDFLQFGDLAFDKNLTLSRGTGFGDFEDAQSFAFPAEGVTGVAPVFALIDLDRDGRMDVVTALRRTLSTFLNRR